MPTVIFANTEPLLEAWSDAARTASAASRLRSPNKSENLNKVARLEKVIHKLWNQGKRDITKISVQGQRIFKSEFKTPRSKMPQIGGDARSLFIDFMKNQGVKSTNKRIAAFKLKPSQAQFDSKRVSQIFRTGKAAKAKRILVSRDGYVVDGHHHWAAAIARDARDGNLGGSKMRVTRVNLPIRKLLPMAQKWAKQQGLKSKAA